MTKLFDVAMRDKIKRNQMRHIAAFCAVCAILAAGAILSAVFWKELTRAWAQTICTVCVISAGCYVVFFIRYTTYSKKMLSICNQAIDRAEKYTVTVTEFEQNCTTYKFLPFHIVDVTLENGEKRRLYLYDGEMTVGQKYAVDVYENIVCAYKETI